MLSIPKLFAVLMLANASLIPFSSIVLKLNTALFLLTSNSPDERGLGAGSILFASSLPIEQKNYSYHWKYLVYEQIQCQNP